MRRALLTSAALALLAVALPAPAQALTFKRCKGTSLPCTRLAVPLDRTGATPGTVSLLVERARTRARRPAGPLVVFAGGPGQSAVRAYGELGGSLDEVRARRDVIVFDQRGTGGSGLLRCPELERANILSARVASARCAGRLGARRAFYTSRDTADDLEAIRRALNVPQLSLYGVSYGTRTALTYARRYPNRVDRMALSSVVAADGADALGLDTLTAVRRVLRNLCAGGACRRVTRDPLGDVAALVARASSAPITGRVYDHRGRGRTATLTARDVLNVLVSGDFEPQLRTEFPAAVRSALRGDPDPMLRLVRRSIAIESVQIDPRDLSAGVYAATTCEESALPWPRGQAFAERLASAQTVVGALDPARLAPFDRTTVLGSDTIDLCREWPQSAVAPDAGLGPLPNVSTLLIEGSDDLRTPLESAFALARQIPRARVVSVSGVGHDPEGQQLSACSEELTPKFFAGRRLPRSCRDYRSRGASVALPARLGQVKAVRGLPGSEGRAIAAARLALLDVADDAAFSSQGETDVARGAGLRGGSYAYGLDSGRLILRGLSLVEGQRVTGRLSGFTTRRQRGTLRLSGARDVRGTIRLRGQSYSGRVGGERVRGNLNLVVASVASVGASAASAQPARRPIP